MRHAVDADVMKRRRKLLLSGVALAVAAAAAAAGLLIGAATQSTHAAALLSPTRSSCCRCAAAKRSGRQLLEACSSRFGAGSLWSLSTTGDLTRIDRSTGKVLANLNTGVSVPCGLAVGEGFVWVTDCTSPTLVQIDPSLDPPVVANRFPLPVHDYGLAWQTHDVALGAGSVWIGQGNANPSYVHRLDPRTGHVEASVLIPQGGAQALHSATARFGSRTPTSAESRGSTHVRTPSRQPPVSVAPTSAVLQPGAGTSGSRRIRTTRSGSSTRREPPRPASHSPG